MDLSVPGAVDTDGQQAQPQPPPRLLEPLGQEERETFAARPGRTLTEPTAAADQQALENEGSRASLGITEVEPDDKQQETLCCCTVIDEASSFRKRWDMVQVLALFYVAVVVPLRTGFGIELDPGSAGWWMELVVDVYFILDLCLNFVTSFYDNDAVLVRAPREIAKRYAKGWLAIDVVSCLPISYVTLAIEAGSSKAAQRGSTPNTKVFKILRLLRLAKLLRLGRLKKIAKRYEEEFENLLGILKLVGAVTVMMYVCHIFACFWYFVGEDAGHLEGWITGQMPIWSPDTAGEGDNAPSPDDVSLMTRYVTSYYWAITTISTVGFGDITATTTAERVFAIIAEMFGSLMFAVLIGMTGSMMVGQKLLEEKVASQIAELREFMEAKRIPKSLRVKIRKYMETLYEEKSGFDEKEVLAQLPPAMAQDLLHHMYKKLLVDVPMFQKLEDGAITMLCSLIKPFVAMQGDCIYSQGQAAREVFIIMQGSIQISFEDGDQEEIARGQTFGEGCLKGLLRKSSKVAATELKPAVREDTSVAQTDADLKFLTLSDLQEVFDCYPQVRATMSEIYLDMNKRREKRAKGELWGMARRQSIISGHIPKKDIQGRPKLMSIADDITELSYGASPRTRPEAASCASPKLPASTGSFDGVDAAALIKVEARIEALEEGLGARIDGLAASVQALVNAMDLPAAGKLDQTRKPSTATPEQP
eukprot:COSAG02_NODE_1134_length_14376_cov_382.343700_2_plen_705_part_00